MSKSDCPGFKFVKLAEVFHLIRVVAVEEYLVEAGEGQDFLVAVEFDLYRNDTSAGGRYIHVLKDFAG